MRFLAAVKNRLTKWKGKDEFKPTLPSNKIERLKEVRNLGTR